MLGLTTMLGVLITSPGALVVRGDVNSFEIVMFGVVRPGTLA